VLPHGGICFPIAEVLYLTMLDFRPCRSQHFRCGLDHCFKSACLISPVSKAVLSSVPTAQGVQQCSVSEIDNVVELFGVLFVVAEPLFALNNGLGNRRYVQRASNFVFSTWSVLINLGAD